MCISWSGVRKRVVSKSVVLADVPRLPKPERGYERRNDGTKNRNEGVKEGTTVPNTGTRAHSPKPPFYKTALLFPLDMVYTPLISGLSGTKIASQNRSDHGGGKRARNHSAAEIAEFFASPAAKKSLAASDFRVVKPQNHRKLAATMDASLRSSSSNQG